MSKFSDNTGKATKKYLDATLASVIENTNTQVDIAITDMNTTLNTKISEVNTAIDNIPDIEAIARTKSSIKDIVSNGIVDGMGVSSSGSLDVTIAKGVCYIDNNRVEIDSTIASLNPNENCYLDLDVNNNFITNYVGTTTAQVDTISDVAVIDNTEYKVTINGTDYSYTSITPVAQVDEITIVNAVDDNVYAVNIDGTVYSYTAETDSTLTTIADGLADLISNSVSDGDSKITITASTAGIAQSVTIDSSTSVTDDITTTTTTDNVAPDTVASLISNIVNVIDDADVLAANINDTNITLTAKIAGTAFIASINSNMSIATTTANNVELPEPATTEQVQRLVKITTNNTEVTNIIDKRKKSNFIISNWNTLPVATSNTTLNTRDFLPVDTTNGSFTVTLPPAPSANDVVAIMDISSSFSTNPLSVARNGNTIMGFDANYEASKKASLLNFTYINDTWHVFETFQTEQVAKPIISIATSVNKQSSIDGNITNYDSEVSYFMSVTNGTVKDNKNGTFQYISPDIDEDETDALTVYGTKAGMFRSENSAVTITVHDVRVESDDAISNANFSDNESYNNGFEY